MAKQLQLRRGTTVQNDAFTGAIGELTMDTNTKQLRLHDGATLGGCGTIDPVVAFQKPTADNNYTWYRKYASGWVEQGGVDTTGTANLHTIEIPVAMSIKRSGQVTTYTSTTDGGTISTQFDPMNNDETHIKIGGRWGTTWSNAWLCWEVKGMAA